MPARGTTGILCRSFCDQIGLPMFAPIEGLEDKTMQTIPAHEK